MRKSYDDLRKRWEDLGQQGPTDDMQEKAALFHYEVAYRSAQVIPQRLLRIVRDAVVTADKQQLHSPESWLGEVFFAWADRDPKSLDPEQRHLYNALCHAEDEAEWER